MSHEENKKIIRGKNMQRDDEVLFYLVKSIWYLMRTLA